MTRAGEIDCNILVRKNFIMLMRPVDTLRNIKIILKEIPLWELGLK
jgi:hypothetical protein